MKKRYILLSITIMLLLIVIGVSINRNIMASWEPTKELIGVWRGTSTIHLGPKSTSQQKEAQKLTIIIHKNGEVSGMIGDAELIDCQLFRNRVRFERFIRVKTDYIISGGYINAKINEHDMKTYRNITIPFNIDPKGLKGSIFHIEKWKYPYPLVPHMELIQE